MKPTPGTISYEVNRLYKESVMRGKIDPAQAALAMHETVGGIASIFYNPNTKFRIQFLGSEHEDISTKGLSKKQFSRLEELAVIAHHLAEASKTGFRETEQSYVQLRPQAGTRISTKHHKPAYIRFQDSVLAKYGMDRTGPGLNRMTYMTERAEQDVA